MAVLDLADVTPPDGGLIHRRVQLPATAGLAAGVRLPRWVQSAFVRIFEADGLTPAAGAFDTAGADGEELEDDAMPILSGEGYEARLHLPSLVYVTGPAGGVARLALGRRP